MSIEVCNVTKTFGRFVVGSNIVVGEVGTDLTLEQGREAARMTGLSLLATMRAHEYGKDAAIIGKVVAEHPSLVTAKTSIGGMRVVDVPAGELLPRIC